jgi:hypothetical protein
MTTPEERLRARFEKPCEMDADLEKTINDVGWLAAQVSVHRRVCAWKVECIKKARDILVNEPIAADACNRAWELLGHVTDECDCDACLAAALSEAKEGE